MVRLGILTLAACAALGSATAQAAPIACSTMIAGNIAWMGGNPHRRIGAKFSRVKIASAATAPASTAWGHVSAAEGAFGWHGSDMTGRFQVAFSDRGFNPAKRDITDITLRADGTGEILLRTWGDARIVLADLRCDSAGFLNALEREANGISMITLSFRRETF